MSIDPKISVVVPVYKVERYLKRCVDSILNQTLTDFELILVDDGSPDECGAICDEYALKDNRVVVIHQENGGLSAARNTGIDWALNNSETEWISFIDSDDWVSPKYLEALYEAVQKTGLSIAICGFERTEQERLPEIEEPFQEEIWKTENFYCKKKVMATVAWGKLYRKKDFTEVRYPIGKIHEDEFTTYKVLFNYENVVIINQPLYAYYQNSQSIMLSMWNPKHMSETEGMLDQLNFFIYNGYQSAAEYMAKIYLISIYRNLIHSREAGNAYISYTRMLKRQLQKGLVKYKKLAEISINNTSWLFYEAYPIATVPYRIYRKCFNKIKR